MNKKVACALLLLILLTAVESKKKRKQDNYDEDEDNVENSRNRVNINMTNIDSAIVDIIWCGSNFVINEDDEQVEIEQDQESRKKIYILTDKGTVYRSVDHGMKWTNINENIQKANQDQIGTQSVIIDTMQVSTYDSQIVYFFGDKGISFKTLDCGKNYQVLVHDAKMESFKLNRAKQDSILAHIPHDCYNQKDDDDCDSEEKQIYVSNDGGQNWTKILDNALDATWDKLVHFALVPDDRILATYKTRRNKRNVLIAAYSDDAFKTINVLAENCIQFYQTEYYLFLLVKDEESTEENYKLMISPAYAGDYKPKQIEIPIKRLKDHSFTILDTSEGMIFLNVNHEDDDSKVGNVYVSDYRGFQFTLSLPLNSRDTEGSCDYQKILGSEGVYISNVYDRAEYTNYSKRKQERNNQNQQGGQNKQPSVKLENLDQYQKTVISFDAGSSWHSLKAPEVDFAGNTIECSGQCSLHLKGRTESNGNPIYSSENAPGVIVATGYYGMYLSEQEKDINTYLSRDGGHSWFQIKQYSHIYEIGDHGGLIVMARDDKSTNQIIYSWDEGETWDEIVLDYEKFEITNILTEPNNMEQKFLVYGQQQKNGSNTGVVIALDFSALHTRVCSGAWEPGAKDSDYEFWYPTNYHGEKCLFGRQIKYVRRKRSSKCFNPEQYEKQYYIESCPCTEEDWECDMGFYRKDEEGPCVPISVAFQKKLSKEPPKDCNGYYTVPSGYKKLPGDYCDGGVDHSPETIECPQQSEQEVPINDSDINWSEYNQDLFKKNDEFNQKKELKESAASQRSPNGLYIALVIALVGSIYFREKVKLFFQKCLLKFKQNQLQKEINNHITQSVTKGYEQLSLFNNEEDP